MDLKKIFTLAMGVAMFTACSDDDDWNTSDATVSMTNQEISFKENKGIVTIPITVEGTLNGPAHITVETVETGENPAMNDVHYLITSKEINIPEDGSSVSVELMTVDDDEINENRTFILRIKDAQGIKIGSQNETLVTLKDNDAVFYEKLQGAWKMTAYNYAGTQVTYDMEISGYEEEEDGYDETLYLSGFMKYSWLEVPMKYSYDATTKKGSLTILYGEPMVEELTGLVSGYAVDVISGSWDENDNPLLEGGIEGTWNDDLTTITFDPNADLTLFVYLSGTTTYAGWWNLFYGIVLSK
jgi:hypothetical protein